MNLYASIRSDYLETIVNAESQASRAAERKIVQSFTSRCISAAIWSATFVAIVAAAFTTGS